MYGVNITETQGTWIGSWNNKASNALWTCVTYYPSNYYGYTFDKKCGSSYCSSHVNFFTQECAKAYNTTQDIYYTCKSDIISYEKACYKATKDYAGYYPATTAGSY